MRFVVTVVGVLALALPLVNALAIPESAPDAQLIQESFNDTLERVEVAFDALADTAGWGYTDYNFKGIQLPIYITGPNIGSKAPAFKSAMIGNGYYFQGGPNSNCQGEAFGGNGVFGNFPKPILCYVCNRVAASASLASREADVEDALALPLVKALTVPEAAVERQDTKRSWNVRGEAPAVSAPDAQVTQGEFNDTIERVEPVEAASGQVATIVGWGYTDYNFRGHVLPIYVTDTGTARMAAGFKSAIIPPPYLFKGGPDQYCRGESWYGNGDFRKFPWPIKCYTCVNALGPAELESREADIEDAPTFHKRGFVGRGWSEPNQAGNMTILYATGGPNQGTAVQALQSVSIAEGFYFAGYPKSDCTGAVFDNPGGRATVLTFPEPVTCFKSWKDHAPVVPSAPVDDSPSPRITRSAEVDAE